MQSVRTIISGANTMEPQINYCSLIMKTYWESMLNKSSNNPKV